MNSTFKLKLIEALNKKNANKGFTLIELLVVVIMIGVLASISFPVLIRQVGRARQVEARNNLGIVNRAQQAFRLENPSFATIANLPVNTTGIYYDPVLTNGTPTATFAAHTVAAGSNYTNDILDYSSAVAQTTAGVFSAIICEMNTPTDSVTPPVDTNTCGLNSRQIGR
jgi:prepilin-type N-terminal cleavage/methylation domain-containing protein